MRVLRIGTANESIQRSNPVDKALFLQKIQRAVNRRRGRIKTGFGNGRQQIIGTQWFMTLPDQFQYQFTDCRQANAFD